MQNKKRTNTQFMRYFISFNFLLVLLSVIAFSSAESTPQKNIKSIQPNSKMELEAYIKKYKSYSGALHNAINKNDLVMLNKLLEYDGVYIKIKKILKGPLYPGFYADALIISDSVGILALQPTTITNSIIVAPVCVRSDGVGLDIISSRLLCDLCIKFDNPNSIFGVNLESNYCSGHLSNSNIFR